VGKITVILLQIVWTPLRAGFDRCPATEIAQRNWPPDSPGPLLYRENTFKRTVDFERKPRTEFDFVLCWDALCRLALDLAHTRAATTHRIRALFKLYYPKLHVRKLPVVLDEPFPCGAGVDGVMN
jgi:hypothetical protein